ncbi:MAG: hypothetical protein AAFW97_00345 [Pseudomonadota bacterium]
MAVLTSQIAERRSELDRLTKEHDALKLALNSLQNLQADGNETEDSDVAEEDLTYQQRLVFEKIPIGRQNALPPVMIGKRCVGLEPDYVRKTLKRLAKYGKIQSEQSRYWRMD